jgi:hypothetical protein
VWAGRIFLFPFFLIFLHAEVPDQLTKEKDEDEEERERTRIVAALN